MTLNIREKINAARDRLVAAGIDNGEAGRDANLLARHVLGWDRATVMTRENEAATSLSRAALIFSRMFNVISAAWEAAHLRRHPHQDRSR